MIACNRCSLPCPRDGVECEKWFHYGCTDIPAYFILHLEEIKNILLYLWNMCVDRLRWLRYFWLLKTISLGGGEEIGGGRRGVGRWRKGWDVFRRSSNCSSWSWDFSRGGGGYFLKLIFLKHINLQVKLTGLLLIASHRPLWSDFCMRIPFLPYYRYFYVRWLRPGLVPLCARRDTELCV